MTCWPRLSVSFCPSCRAMMSVPPPGAKPTMARIGRFGKPCCAFAGSAASARTAKTNEAADERLYTLIFRAFTTGHGGRQVRGGSRATGHEARKGREENNENIKGAKTTPRVVRIVR